MPLSTCIIRDTKSSYELKDDKNKWKPGIVEAVVEEIKKTKIEEKSEGKSHPERILYLGMKVLKNAELLRNVIQKVDEPILEHLKYLFTSSQMLESLQISQLNFSASSDYLSNEVLTKTYLIKSHLDDFDLSFLMDHKLYAALGAKYIGRRMSLRMHYRTGQQRKWTF